VELYLHFPSTPLCRGAQLKHRDNLPLYVTHASQRNAKILVNLCSKRENETSNIFPIIYRHGFCAMIGLVNTRQIALCIKPHTVVKRRNSGGYRSFYLRQLIWTFNYTQVDRTEGNGRAK
jgi:hypothetical protein